MNAEARRLSRIMRLLAVFYLVVTAFLAAQGGLGRGRLTGVVLDEEKRPIPSAKVILVLLGKSEAQISGSKLLRTDSARLELTTDEDGKWRQNQIGGGWWNIEASAEGYHSANRDCFVRELSSNPHVELILAKVGAPETASTPSLLEKANDLYYAKKYDEAMAAFRDYLKRAPWDMMAALSVAYCLQDKGDLDAAIAEFEAIAKKTSKDARDAYLTGRAYAGMAECYHERKDEKSAKAFFIKALEAFPNEELWAYNAGEIAYAHGQIDEAIRYYEKARTISPSWADPFLKLGYCWLTKGDNARAIEAFEKFLKLEPRTKRTEDAAKILAGLKKEGM